MAGDKSDEVNNSDLKMDYTGDNLIHGVRTLKDIDNEEELEQLLKKQWDELFEQKIEEEKSFDHILHKIHYDINTRGENDKKKGIIIRIARSFSRIAAILIVPLSIYSAIQFFNKKPNTDMSWIEINAPGWTRTQFRLPDGTIGWLNNNSSIRYYENFYKKRDVVLSGEVYLDVSRNLKKPFNIKAGEIMVTVTGTKLNIVSYDDEDIVEVVLEEGEVICSDIEMQDSYILKPNDYLTFNKTTRDFTIKPAANEKYSSWKDGRLVFRNDPLDVIARRLERWYNIEVDLKGDFSDKPTLRATFLDENLEEVLELLRLSLSVNYEIERPKIQADSNISKIKVIITSRNN